MCCKASDDNYKIDVVKYSADYLFVAHLLPNILPNFLKDDHLQFKIINHNETQL